MVTATTSPVRLPRGPRWPQPVQGAAFIADRPRRIARWSARYGPVFSLDIPIFGRTVVVAQPELIKDVFATPADLMGPAGNLGDVFGPGSTFSLHGDEHRERRKLLVPPFAGRRVAGYETIVEQEVLREVAGWPEGRSFAVLPSMMHITVKAILRAVFGAEGQRLDELSELLPRGVALGAQLAILPSWARRDLGPLSPWGRVQRIRRRYDEIVGELIDAAQSDPDLAQRTDVLSMLLQARYDDGTPISRAHVGDELLTLLAAGHETTATTLAWTVERLTRHPAILKRLVEEADAGGGELRQAVIWEVQRIRPVIDFTARRTLTRIELGPWVIPAGATVLVGIGLSHASTRNFDEPSTFDPERFLDDRPDTSTWIPFGGGIRRCVGAAFANMEMDVVIRTLLREFDFASTAEPDEPVRSRGVATAPGRGGRTVVHRRRTASRAVNR